MDKSRVLRVIYLSKATRSFQHGELLSMCARFAVANSKREITGVLIRIGNYFVQVIEGHSVAIDDLIEKIRKDPRNECLTIISRHFDESRAFADWSMTLIDAESYYYVNLNEIQELREQIEDMLINAYSRKDVVLLTIKRIAAKVAQSKTRQRV